MSKGEEYTGGQEAIVLFIPSGAIKLKVDATVMVDGEKKRMRTKLNREGIMACRDDYHELDPDDTAFATYKINPEFQKFMDIGLQLGKTQEQILDAWAAYHGDRESED